jgi:DNA-binding transcriptional MerR regulator
VSERPYLSIGEVLGLLLEEFPDVTISKIRFLESQGLIDPERTPSGYRKFYDPDVDRLRVILREQRENFLPLRVIRDRLENGTIEGEGNTPPRGIRNVTVADEPAPTEVTTTAPEAAWSPALDTFDARDAYGPAELCALAGITTEQLAELESFGLVAGRGSGAGAIYTVLDLDIATAAAGFLQRGIEGRHLRGWKQAAEREGALFEQLVMPLVRQRNPQARQQAVATLNELAELGGRLRAALLRAALRHHLDD